MPDNLATLLCQVRSRGRNKKPWSKDYADAARGLGLVAPVGAKITEHRRKLLHLCLRCARVRGTGPRREQYLARAGVEPQAAAIVAARFDRWD